MMFLTDFAGPAVVLAAPLVAAMVVIALFCPVSVIR